MSQTPSPNSEPKSPIVLGHAACTGGSLIYRIILTTFGFTGLSEVGLARILSNHQYNPWDPEFQLFANQLMSAQDFCDVIFQRTLNCKKKLDSNGMRLLVREHTHSFYFNPLDDAIVPNGGSWFSDKYREQFGDDLPCLVSVRNPIDSWLGFRTNFPLQEPRDFDQYCLRYNQYLDKIDEEHSRTGRFFVFKYEDLIADPNQVVEKIAYHIGEPACEANLSAVGRTIGSGNSGRSSKALEERSRRPFTSGFFKRDDSEQRIQTIV